MMSRLLMRMSNIMISQPWKSVARPGMAATMSQQSVDRDRPKYKAVIFDMGGVLLPSPFEMFRGKSNNLRLVRCGCVCNEITVFIIFNINCLHYCYD